MKSPTGGWSSPAHRLIEHPHDVDRLGRCRSSRRPRSEASSGPARSRRTSTSPADALPLLAPGIRAVDLGSGGGALGLPACGTRTPGAVDVRRVERHPRRLPSRGRQPGSSCRTRPWCVAQPAEVAGRADELRGVFDLVVARSFGPPATTAECGAPLLRAGGILAVTEPPEADGARWPVEGLALLGLVLRERVGAFQTLEQASRCPDRFPRRTGVPRQRPLF